MLLRHLVHPADAAVRQQLQHGVIELAEVIENGRVHVHRAAAAVAAIVTHAAAAATTTTVVAGCCTDSAAAAAVAAAVTQPVIRVRI